MRNDWSTVKVPRPLLDRAEHLIRSNPELGYNSISDFVKDSVRRLCMDLEGYTGKSHEAAKQDAAEGPPRQP